MNRPALLLLLAIAPMTLLAQEPRQTERLEGIREQLPGVYALTNARVVMGPGRILEDATLVIRDGVLEAIGADVTPPPDAHVRDQAGLTLYPGFIDAHSDLGLEEIRVDTARGPVHWNPQVRPFIDAAEEFLVSEDRTAEFRGQGVTVVHAVPPLGIFRGQSALVSLGEDPYRDRILRSGISQSVSFARDTDIAASYPNSSMGAIALIRQTLLDAAWYGEAQTIYERNPVGLRRPETNPALASLGTAVRGEQPLLFEVRSEEEYLRTQALFREFPQIRPWIRGSGQEYRILDVLDAALPLILPLNFPDPPEVENPEDALGVTLSTLRHWHLAPENPGRLAAAGIEFALTLAGLDEAEEFLPNLRRAVVRGLPTDIAVAALTVNPARMLGIERTHGTLDVGKVANIVAVDGDLFDDEAEIRDVWVDGRRYEISTPPRVDPRGEWLVAWNGGGVPNGRLSLEGSLARLTGSFTVNEEEEDLESASIQGEEGRLRFSVPGEILAVDGLVRFSGSIEGDVVYGWSEFPDGTAPSWRAERVAGPDPDAGAPSVATASSPSGTGGGGADEAASDDEADDGSGAPSAQAILRLADIRPAMEFGRETLPEQPQSVLVRNATIWTMGPSGLMENADLLVTSGRISQVGQGLQAPTGAVVIDAAGRHVTPGLIDPHLHSGISSVNESGSNIVPEVRVGDVLTHNNISMYRQLAGGLTLAHLKHGSANPIGGENVIVKMRWGALPDELRFDGAPRTVKFALGENPVSDTRYPGTRMGVEEIIRDNFNAAREYREIWREWEAGNGAGIPPRRDLRMDALVDILEERLLISAHGYRQDEFLMLVRLAQEFDFNVLTLQHGVEAYKIAPELAEAGVAAIVWSDWSSFKIEAYDGMTYNARLLTEAGVLTSLHSDDSQVASRMNWEAGKMVRAGMAEEDALALVTINPARILRIDDRVGSLEVGKDADFVIWSGNPLSQFTRAEQTWVDGRRYFDLTEDRELRRQVQSERAQLIQLALDND